MPHHFNLPRDLTGQKFGRWTVVRKVGANYRGDGQWLCLCSCGKTGVVERQHLRRGKSQSCGCLKAEVCGYSSKTHGMSNTSEYVIWRGIKRRCHDKRNAGYPRYGALGVRVCVRWRKSFQDFFEDVGPRPSPRHQLDRHPDPWGNYEPGNVRWALPKENCRNKRNNSLLTYKGRTLCLSAWAEDLGMPISTFLNRLKNGWSLKDAIERPHRWSPRTRRLTHKGRSLTIAEWAKELGLQVTTIRYRLQSGWSVHASLTVPVRPQFGTGEHRRWNKLMVLSSS